MWKCENFLSSLAPLARIFIEVRSSMLVFCRYFVVYSAIPQKGTALIVYVYMYIQMCFHVFMFLCDFNRFFSLFFFFFFFFFTNSDPVSVCVVLYVIILIQILIRYNVKNLITACTRSLDFDLKNWKISHLSLFPLGAPPPPPPQCVDPRYATDKLVIAQDNILFIIVSMYELWESLEKDSYM